MTKFQLPGANLSVERLVKILRQGANLIEDLSDEVYARRDQANQGSVGAHFRHIIEFVFRFTEGIETGKVDYHRRERDSRIERNRDYAVLRFYAAISELRNLPANIEHKQIWLRLENSEADGEEWCISSPVRELEYLQSHTIHHYALIAEKLYVAGIKVEKNFGVAPSTLEFWRKQPPQENYAYRQIVGL